MLTSPKPDSIAGTSPVCPPVWRGCVPTLRASPRAWSGIQVFRAAIKAAIFTDGITISLDGRLCQPNGVGSYHQILLRAAGGSAAIQILGRVCPTHAAATSGRHRVTSLLLGAAQWLGTMRERPILRKLLVTISYELGTLRSSCVIRGAYQT